MVAVIIDRQAGMIIDGRVGVIMSRKIISGD